MTGVSADEYMSDIDALVWAVEHDPRNRTTIAALARFDRPLDAATLRHRVDRASRVVPRLRQRVIADSLGIAPPRWSVDPEFRLSFHLRSTALRDGDQSLVDVVRDIVVQPFDRHRPLWEFTHITGFDDGGSALLLKAHHALSDGVGGVELMLELFDLDTEPAADRHELPPAPTPPAQPAPLGASLRHEAGAALATIGSLLASATTPRSIPDVADASRHLGEALGSATRMFSPPKSGAALPSDRSAGLDVRFFSVPLNDLRSAGRRFDGTINDAFVAAVVMGVADYRRHSASSDEPSPLQISIPINTRGDSEEVGNHWTPGRIEIDLVGADDAATVCVEVRQAMQDAKGEPGHQLLGPLAAGLRRLPATATSSIFTSLSAGVDVTASNVPGSPVPLYLCGQPVAAMIPFGPLIGCAINLTLMSYAGVAHIGVSSDPAVVSNPDDLLVRIQDGFTAVVKGS